MWLLLPPLRPYYLSARCRCRPEAGFCFNIFKIRAVVTEKVIRQDRNFKRVMFARSCAQTGINWLELSFLLLLSKVSNYLYLQALCLLSFQNPGLVRA